MIVARFILVVVNIINVYIDAYKINKALKLNVSIAVRHGINFGVYLALTITLLIVYQPGLWVSVLFLLDAFFNRQITFDIPLNWRRGLKWDYVSQDRPPKATMDRIEVAVFGYNGRLSVAVYLLGWLLTILMIELK